MILDALMPKLTGPEVYRRISAEHPGTKMVLCSAFGLAAPQTSPLLEEGLRLVEKPFDAETLLSTVRQVLDEERAEPPPSLALQHLDAKGDRNCLPCSTIFCFHLSRQETVLTAYSATSYQA